MQTAQKFERLAILILGRRWRQNAVRRAQGQPHGGALTRAWNRAPE